VPAVVHSEHGRDILPVITEPLRRRVFRRLSYRLADRVFAVSRQLKNEYESALKISPNLFGLIYNGVDTRLFSPDAQKRREERATLGISEDTVVIGCVARLEPVKDHMTLLRAATIALDAGHDMRIVLVGEGPERPALEYEIKMKPALRDRVIFTGRSFDVARRLCGFDIFVLPSLFEGISNTLLEAMATGLPVVATRVGGNPEIFEDNKSGLMFYPRDIQGLADHLTRLASCCDLRKRLGAEARKHVEQCFSLEQMLKNYSDMYSEIISKKQSLP
jgi:glycosyltransferase involved in cell wall biosynthesis